MGFVTPPRKYNYAVYKARQLKTKYSPYKRVPRAIGMGARTYNGPRWSPSSARTTTKKKIGFPPGTGTALKRETIDDWAGASIDPRVLTQDELTLIPEKVAATTDISRRERAMINCLGFSMRIHLRNTDASNEVTVRLAVVSPTDKNEINVNGFFRGYGTTRATDFVTGLDSHRYIDTPINTDNFSILWSTKVRLGPDNDLAGAINYTRNIDNYCIINKYVKLNRQLRYDGPLSSDCADKVFLLMWYDGTSSVAASPVNAGTVKYQRYAITYWKDPGQS